MKQNLVKIKGHSGYARVKDTGIVLNINKNEIQTAREKKQRRLQNEKEIKDLKNEVSNIKSMLKTIVEKLDG